MDYQDDFARRNGGGGGPVRPEPVEGQPSLDTDPLTGSGRTGGAKRRHPEFISGPRAAKPEGRGETREVLKRVQDDDDTHTGKGDEHAPDNPVRLERSRETGDGRGVSRLRSTRTDGDNGCLNTVSGEPVEPRLTSENRPSTGSGLRDQNANTPTPRHDGWHPELRVKFLEALARTGNVQASAYFVQRSRQSAYDLKRRDPDFARGWLAALVLAREEAQDKLQERAIEGVEEQVFYHGEVVATRRRYDSRLLLAHLARLDKIAEQIPALRGAARFGEMLDAIGAGEDTTPLIATPTEDELTTQAAEAEAWQHPRGKEAEQELEFYAVSFPDHDGPPEYYRMSAEEAAEMERDVPGLTAIPTGTADNAVISIIAHEAEALAGCGFGGPDGAEKGKNL